MKVNSAQLITMVNMIKAQSATSVTFVPTDDGWTFYSRDPAVISLMSGTIFANAFPEGYEKWDPFAISIDFLLDVLPKSGDVDITLDNGSVIVKHDKNRDKYRLDSIETTEGRMPSMPLNTTVTVGSDVLLSVAGDKIMFGKDEFSNIRLIAKDNLLTFSASTEKRECERSFEAEITGSSASHFSANYLKNIFKALPKGETVDMSSDDDYPLKMEINTEYLSMCIFIAPVIVEE